MFTSNFSSIIVFPTQYCAGEMKNVTKLRSDSLMIECLIKQQSLNLLAFKHITSNFSSIIVFPFLGWC
jgi:hypothetical protein